MFSEPRLSIELPNFKKRCLKSFTFNRNRTNSTYNLSYAQVSISSVHMYKFSDHRYSGWLRQMMKHIDYMDIYKSIEKRFAES